MINANMCGVLVYEGSIPWVTISWLFKCWTHLS